MIISPGRGFVFVHIPKTGGTALTLALEGRAMRDDILIGDTPKARRRKGRLKHLNVAGRVWKHSTLADLDGYEDLSNLYAFTMVRNPWDRAVSFYHWLRVQRFDHPAVGLSQTLDFDSFVRHPVITGAWASSPASHYMRRADGTEQCACYIRLERFEQDAVPVFSKLGFRVSLPRANVSARARDWRGYFTDAGAAAVADACAEDIARFGYGFDDARPDQ